MVKTWNFIITIFFWPFHWIHTIYAKVFELYVLCFETPKRIFASMKRPRHALSTHWAILKDMGCIGAISKLMMTLQDELTVKVATRSVSPFPFPFPNTAQKSYSMSQTPGHGYIPCRNHLSWRFQNRRLQGVEFLCHRRRLLSPYWIGVLSYFNFDA